MSSTSKPHVRSSPAGLEHRPTRPFSVSLVMLGVLIIASMFLVRFCLSLKQWQFLAGLPGVSPLYLALSGIIFSVVFFILLCGLLIRRVWSLRGTQISAGICFAAFWLERGVITLRSALASGEAFTLPDPASDIVFQVLWSCGLLFFVFWSLSRKKVKAYFGVAHE